ncbi:MAG: citrate synthase [Oscillospiraceae bacterium]|nr:citrate synthase [Oscillospiraceae bacterium]
MKKESLNTLFEEFKKYNYIDAALNEKYGVKRGLRNSDGTGVLAGLTQICNVHGYVLSEGEKTPVEGELTYRGIDVRELVENCVSEGRYGYEEASYLLLFGHLPGSQQLEFYRTVLSQARALPMDFVQDMILKSPSRDVMNKLGRSILSLYSYDEFAEETGLEAELKKALHIIARMPTIMVNGYMAKIGHYDNESTYFHPVRPGETIAQSILSTLRISREYTEEEAHLLDVCLMLHAEHGGGNNSTFVCRAMTSSGTDAYAAYSAAVGALKGFRHGGANIKVCEMFDEIKENVKNWQSDSELSDYLWDILQKKRGDGSGLIYGMGHAVYTLSDPRAGILRDNAEKLADKKGMREELELLKSIERLTPIVMAERKGASKEMCANVDLYSGFVYRMLGIPQELFTPLFATARMSGWCAHRIEEYMTCSRIMRPAYKSVVRRRNYVPISER